MDNKGVKGYEYMISVLVTLTRFGAYNQSHFVKSPNNSIPCNKVIVMDTWIAY